MPASLHVMAGLGPATPIVWHGRAPVIGVAGTSPAMTERESSTSEHAPMLYPARPNARGSDTVNHGTKATIMRPMISTAR
jgi:hypothetical protein